MPDDPSESQPVAVTPLLWVSPDGVIEGSQHRWSEYLWWWAADDAVRAARWMEDGFVVAVESFQVAGRVLVLLGASAEDVALAVTSARDGLANMKTEL